MVFFKPEKKEQERCNSIICQEIRPEKKASSTSSSSSWHRFLGIITLLVFLSKCLSLQFELPVFFNLLSFLLLKVHQRIIRALAAFLSFLFSF